MQDTPVDVQKMSLSKLPFEILNHIFLFLPSPHDLSSVRLTSPLFSLAAQRALFRHLDFASRPARLQTVFLLLRMLSLRPDLAAHVRSLEISYIPGMRRRVVPACTRSLFRALQCMTHLARLHIVIQSSEDVMNLAQCTFRLKALGVTSNQPVQLEQLFHVQTDLEELTLHLPWIDQGARDAVKDLSSSLLPKLHTVSAHWRVALELLSSRPVEHVFLFDRWSVLDISKLRYIIPRVGMSSLLLQSFSAAIVKLDEHVLKLFSQHLPHLVDLALVITSADGSEGLAAIDALVSPRRSHCFSSLTTLSLSATRWSTLASQSYAASLDRIGAACPSLNEVRLSAEVVVAHDPPLEGSVTFRRNWSWGRQSDAKEGMWWREEAFEELTVLRSRMT